MKIKRIFVDLIKIINIFISYPLSILLHLENINEYSFFFSSLNNFKFTPTKNLSLIVNLPVMPVQATLLSSIR